MIDTFDLLDGDTLDIGIGRFQIAQSYILRQGRTLILSGEDMEETVLMVNVSSDASIIRVIDGSTLIIKDLSFESDDILNDVLIFVDDDSKLYLENVRFFGIETSVTLMAVNGELTANNLIFESLQLTNGGGVLLNNGYLNLSNSLFTNNVDFGTLFAVSFDNISLSSSPAIIIENSVFDGNDNGNLLVFVEDDSI